ncbi:hypothetical protein CVT26_014595 [Gymnopilus dilepis]|uniref:Uncharacterized protein n=1 Tax=Gymnopilus dilepis TaxID=231916 RepID=A0A409VVN6_9AGAR|nr:hypothetical protein CVT26_014595 [Gymnopilus dilepis]
MHFGNLLETVAAAKSSEMLTEVDLSAPDGSSLLFLALDKVFPGTTLDPDYLLKFKVRSCFEHWFRMWFSIAAAGLRFAQVADPSV